MVSREREEMAILCIKMIDGKFSTTSGALVERQTEKEIFGNGWKARILQDGAIECVSKNRYLDGIHSIKYTVFPDGTDRISIWTPRDGKRILYRGRAFTDKGEPISGIICLSGGKIDERFAYFRSLWFQKFLDNNNLSGVRFVEPNKRFTLLHMHNKAEGVFSDIYTDGSTETEAVSSYKENGLYFKCKESIIVSGATWTVLQKEKISGGESEIYSVLYTKKQISDLELPKLPTSPNRKLYIQ